MPYSAFRQGKIFYETTGKGKVLVLLHGFLESSEIWKSLAEKLSPGHKVVCIDLPGHGRSDCFGYVHSMELMADAVNKVMQDLNLRRYIMVGHSMGGYVALAYAKKYTTHLKGLILFQSTPLSDTEEKKADRDRIARLIPGKREVFIREALPGLFHPARLEQHPEHLEFLRDIANKTSYRGIVAALMGMKNRPDSVSFIKQVAIPIVFILGSDDKVLPLSVHGELWKLPAAGLLLVLEESGHLGMLEAEDASCEALKKSVRFCNKKDKARPE